MFHPSPADLPPLKAPRCADAGAPGRGAVPPRPCVAEADPAAAAGAAASERRGAARRGGAGAGPGQRCALRRWFGRG